MDGLDARTMGFAVGARRRDIVTQFFLGIAIDFRRVAIGIRTLRQD
jgi:ribosomal protein L13E